VQTLEKEHHVHSSEAQLNAYLTVINRNDNDNAAVNACREMFSDHATKCFKSALEAASSYIVTPSSVSRHKFSLQQKRRREREREKKRRW
jgi:hypothetical protein